MIKIGLCGHLANGHTFNCGQTIKTRIFLEEIEKRNGKENTISVDTFNWKKNPIKLFLNLLNMVIKSDKILIFPGKNGLRVIMPIIYIMVKFLRKDIYYIVVGGWLAQYIKNKKLINIILKNFNGIYIESKALVKEMQERGYRNVDVLYNTKDLKHISLDECAYIKGKTIKICTFSRVMKEKGITDIINAVSFINNKYSKNIFTLDIYGEVDKEYIREFNDLLEGNSKYIRYCGVADYKNTINIIKDYYMLIFPTYYEGECFPGTIIDAYFSGVPVLATNWKYNNEFIDHMITGILYEPNNIDELIKNLMFIMENYECIIGMRKKCIEKSYQYSPEVVINKLMNLII